MNGSRLERALQDLRRRGWRLTAARRVVIEVLAERRAHLSAPEVVAAVARRAPRVGRASVYRALALLTRLGVLQASSLGGAITTYALTTGCHHHVICRTCRRTVELDTCELEGLERELTARLGYRIEGHLLELYGRCPACLAAHKEA